MIMEDEDEYFVSVADWGTGMGYVRLQAKVTGINNAVIVKAALEQIFPRKVQSGDKNHVFEVKINNVHKGEK